LVEEKYVEELKKFYRTGYVPQELLQQIVHTMDMKTVLEFLKLTYNNKAFASWVAQRRIDELYRESKQNSEAVVPSLKDIAPKGPQPEKKKLKGIGSGEQKPSPVRLTKNDERKIAAKKKKEEMFQQIEDERNSRKEFSQTFGYEKPIYGTTLCTVMVPKKFEYPYYFQGCGGEPEIRSYTKRVPEKRERRMIISRKWIPADTKDWYREWKEDYDFIKKYGTKYLFNSLKPWNLKDTRLIVEEDLEHRREQAKQWAEKKEIERKLENEAIIKRKEEEEKRIEQAKIDEFVKEEKLGIMDIEGMMNFITSKKWNNVNINKFGLDSLALGYIMFATNASVTVSDPTCITSSHPD